MGKPIISFSVAGKCCVDEGSREIPQSLKYDLPAEAASKW